MFWRSSHARPAHFGRAVHVHTQEVIRKAEDSRARMEAKLDQVFKALSNSNKFGGGGGGNAAVAASANTVIPRTMPEGEPPPTFIDRRASRREPSSVVASRESIKGADGGGAGSAIVGGGHGDGGRQPQGGKDWGSDRPQAQSSEPDLDQFIDQFHSELR